MNIIVPRSITNIAGIDSFAIKLWSYLFTLWLGGQYDDYAIPTIKELESKLNMSHTTIEKAITNLQSIQVKDRFQTFNKLLTIKTKSIKERAVRVFELALPEYGKLTEPENFKKGDNGGEATISAIGGYFTITDDIQKLGFTVNRELILALLGHISKDERKLLYNYKVAHVRGYFECMSDVSIESTMKRLKKDGYFEPSKPVKIGKYWGWESVSINLNPKKEPDEKKGEELMDIKHPEREDDDIKSDNTPAQEDDMDTDKQQALIEKAMEAGNMELAMKLAEAMSSSLRKEAKSDDVKEAEKKTAKPKAKKSDMEEMDFQNDYIKVYVSVPKSIAKNPTITGMIRGLKESIAYSCFTLDELEATGYEESLREYGVRITAEQLQEPPKYDPEISEDVIQSSIDENRRLFGSEPPEVQQHMDLIAKYGLGGFIKISRDDAAHDIA